MSHAKQIDCVHRFSVPCNCEGRAKHVVTVATVGSAVVSVQSTCGREGDTITRLGGVSCFGFAQSVRYALATSTAHAAPWPRALCNIMQNHKTIVRDVRYAARAGYTPQDADSAHIDHPLPRLLEGYVNKLSPGIAWKAVRLGDGAVTIGFGRSDRHGREAIKRYADGRWELDTAAVRSSAVSVGYDAYGPAPVCHVCKKYANHVWKDVRQHARGAIHVDAVLLEARRVHAALSRMHARGEAYLQNCAAPTQQSDSFAAA